LKWFVDTRPVTQVNEFLGQPYFAHVMIINNSKYRDKESTANKVIALIEAYNLKGELVLGPIIGRWGDSPQPVVRPFPPKSGEMQHTTTRIASFVLQTKDSPEVEISSNGLPKELNIALKWPESSECYLFNNNSYGYTRFENPKMKLKSNNHKIRITLSGENVDDTELWFLLINKGKNKGFSINRLS